MECSASRRAVVVFVLAAIALAPIAAFSASASAATYTRRHHRHHTRHRRRRHHRRAGTASQPAPVAQDACPGSSSSAQGASLQTMRSAAVCEINLQRAAHGLPRLAESTALDNSAQGWSQAMVAAHQLTHGASFTSRISAAGYSWGSAGENIATGFSTPRGVVAGWMASLEHCRNILTPGFRDVGIGEVPAGIGTGPATWTADFGLRLLASPPSSNSGPANGCPY
jgi:uncharacterized protein YkwD